MTRKQYEMLVHELATRTLRDARGLDDSALPPTAREVATSWVTPRRAADVLRWSLSLHRYVPPALNYADMIVVEVVEEMARHALQGDILECVEQRRMVLEFRPVAVQQAEVRQ